MASFNRVMIMGNLTRDPEQKYTSGGTPFCNIDLAVNDKRKDQQGNWINETTFVNVTLWGRTAEVACEFCRKGSPLFIEGKLKLDKWEKDGQKFSKLKVVGERLQLIGNKGDSATQAQRSADNSDPYSEESQSGGFEDNDIPF